MRLCTRHRVPVPDINHMSNRDARECAGYASDQLSLTRVRGRWRWLSSRYGA
jgi:hypothetical protein